ncbi:flippase [Candidatus Uhrbacteria bacterium]|nr:flippase [Candidatus Uhrbacteria bacterium]
MSVARALALNTGVQIAGKFVSTIIGVIVVGLMTRHLGQEGFGMYSTANAFFSFFALFLDFGLNVMVVQMLGERAGDAAYERRVVSAAFTLRVISALILLGIAPVIGLAFPYPWELKLALFAIWGSFFFAVLNQIVIGVQQRHLKMHVVAIGEVSGRLVLLIGILVARSLGWGLVPIVLIVSVGGAVNFLINFFVAQRYASFAWNVDIAFWKTLLRRSWPIGISIIFNLIYFKADTLILSFIRPQAEVGIYGAAYRVLEILITLPFMYAGVLLPIIAKQWAGRDRERFGRLLSHSYNAMLILAAPLVAGTLLLATRGMILVAGPDFAVSGGVLQILILAVGMIFFGTVSSHAIVALDAQRSMLPIYIAVAVVTLAGYILFIPTYGMWAAAWLTVFSEFCIALGSTAMVIKKSGARWSPAAGLKAVAAAVVMAFVIRPLQDLPLVIPVLAGAATYTLLVLASGAVSKETIRDILSIRKPPPTLENPLG